jgi:hypothetical protein
MVGGIFPAMTKQPKRPRDPAQLAKFIVDIATGQIDDSQASPESAITPASHFARAGGLKGGKARAEKLSAKRRKEIARKAAATRWRGK